MRIYPIFIFDPLFDWKDIFQSGIFLWLIAKMMEKKIYLALLGRARLTDTGIGKLLLIQTCQKKSRPKFTAGFNFVNDCHRKLSALFSLIRFLVCPADVQLSEGDRETPGVCSTSRADLTSQWELSKGTQQTCPRAAANSRVFSWARFRRCMSSGMQQVHGVTAPHAPPSGDWSQPHWCVVSLSSSLLQNVYYCNKDNSQFVSEQILCRNHWCYWSQELAHVILTPACSLLLL